MKYGHRLCVHREVESGTCIPIKIIWNLSKVKGLPSSQSPPPAHDLSWHCRGNWKGVPVSDEKVDDGEGSKGFCASKLEKSFNKNAKCNKHFFKRKLISYVTRAQTRGRNVAGLCCAVCALCKSISADDYATYTESYVYVHTRRPRAHLAIFHFASHLCMSFAFVARWFCCCFFVRHLLCR